MEFSGDDDEEAHTAMEVRSPNVFGLDSYDRACCMAFALSSMGANLCRVRAMRITVAGDQLRIARRNLLIIPCNLQAEGVCRKAMRAVVEGVVGGLGAKTV